VARLFHWCRDCLLPTAIMALFSCLVVANNTHLITALEAPPRGSGFAFPAQGTGPANLPAGDILSRRARVFALVKHRQGALAVGARGFIRLLDGASELQLSPPVAGRTANFYSGAEGASGRLWLGSDVGRLYVASADLQTWQQIDLQEDAAVFALAEYPDGKLFAIGQYGLLRVKQADSDPWQSVDLPWAEWLAPAWQEYGEAMPHLFGTCQAGDSLFVVGEFGIILEYDGQSWHKRHGGSIEPAFYACASQGGRIVAVGQRGSLARSADSGRQWQDIKLGGPSIFQVIALPQGQWLAVGEQRRIWWTDAASGQWRCGHFDSTSVGWFVDALLAADQRRVTVAGAGALLSIPLSEQGEPVLPQELTCG